MKIYAMVVEDERWVRRALVKRVETLSPDIHVAAEAASYEQALFSASQLKRLDVLLTDIMLPDRSGLDLIEPIRSWHPNSRVYIISGYADFHFAQRAINLGVNGYLLKPIKDLELKRVVSIDGICPGEGAAPDDEGGEAIKRLRAYVRSNIAGDLSLKALSREFGYSESYLSRWFKASAGEGLWEYITRLRMDAACKLLAQTDITIAALAEQLHYSDASYFSRAFQKRLGLLPGEYRKLEQAPGCGGPRRQERPAPR